MIDMKAASKGALLGGLGAGVLCVGIYFAAAALQASFTPKDPASMGGMEVLPFFQPIVNCLLAALVSIALLVVLRKLLGDAKAWSVYIGVAVLVFLVEAYLPFWAFADLKTIVALELMHVPAALGVVGGIHFFGRSPQPAAAA